MPRLGPSFPNESSGAAGERGSRQKQKNRLLKVRSLLFSFIRKEIRKLGQLYFYSVQAFTALGDVKLHLVVVANLVDALGYVNEDVFAGLVHFDETKTFGLIEEFYSSCLHGTCVMVDFLRVAVLHSAYSSASEVLRQAVPHMVLNCVKDRTIF